VTEEAKYGVLVTHQFGSSLSETVELNGEQTGDTDRSRSNCADWKRTDLCVVRKSNRHQAFHVSWKNGKVEIPETNADQYTVTEAGVYSVVVKNVVGSASSEAAVVSIVSPVEITVQPLKSQVARPGDNVEFSVVATGEPVTGNETLRYQWFRASSEDGEGTALQNGANISGATASKLILSSVTSGNSGTAGRYFVKVTGQLGSKTSRQREVGGRYSTDDHSGSGIRNRKGRGNGYV